MAEDLKQSDNTPKVPAEIPAETSKKGSIIQHPHALKTGITLLAVITIISLYLFWHASYYESTDDAFIDSSIVQISPKISGPVTKVYIQDNQMVKEGDLLVEIDSRDYQVALSQASAGWQGFVAQKNIAKYNAQMTGITSIAQTEEASAAVQSSRSNVKMVESQLNAAKSRLEQADASVTTAKANAEAAKADIIAAQAQSEQADADANRANQLLKDGVISKQDKEHAVTAAQSAKAQLSAIRKRSVSVESQVVQAIAAHKEAVNNLHQIESQYQQSQSDLAKAAGFLRETNVAPQKQAVSKANLESNIHGADYFKSGIDKAALELSYTKIYAPVSGKVTRKSIEVGNYIQVGQALMAIVPKEVWVTANFKETQLTYMHPGQTVYIKVDAYPSHIFKGHIESIQSGTGSRFSLFPPENASGNYVKVVQRVPVKILFDESFDSKYILAPGMSVVPEVSLK